MIISHSEKYIFVKTHKTGGTSLQIALSSYCSTNDIISKLHSSDLPLVERFQGITEQNNIVPFRYYNYREWIQYTLKGRKQYYSEHLPVQQIIRRLSSESWKTYYKFCFERNPFDKFLSYYYWRTRNTKVTIQEFLDSSLKGLSDFNMYTINGEVVVDEVFLYENLEESMNMLSSRIPGVVKMNDITAKSEFRDRRDHYLEVLSNTQLKSIAKEFKSEILFFYPDLDRYL